MRSLPWGTRRDCGPSKRVAKYRERAKRKKHRKREEPARQLERTETYRTAPLTSSRRKTLSVAEAVIDARAYELDSFGHVNHAVYLNYFEQARFEVLKDCGFTYDELARRGWAIHVVRTEVDYLSEVLLGDRLRIRTWTEGFRRTSMVFLQEARRDPRGGEADSIPVARARVVAVWIGGNGRPTRVPEEVRDGFGNLEAPEA